MKVTFSKNNNKTIKVLPYISEENIEINYGDANTETFDSFKHGTIIVKGAKPLTEITFSGMFPNGLESWMESDADGNPMHYKNFFRDALQKGTVLRVTLQRNGKTLAMLNMNCIVTAFTLQAPNRRGDIQYSLTVSQYVKLSTKR